MRLPLALAALLFCASATAAEDSPATPAIKPTDFVQFNDLKFTQGLSDNLLHTSLDNAPEIPPDGVTIELECKIESTRFEECRTTQQPNDAAKPFLSIALMRLYSIRFEAVTDSGIPVKGKRCVVSHAIVRAHRFDNPRVDFSRGDQLIFEVVPNGQDLSRFYPMRSLERDVEANVDMGCIVMNGQGVRCPDIRVELPFKDPLGHDVLFTQAAEKIARIFRVAPLTKDGKSSVGTGFRKRIKFRIR